MGACAASWWGTSPGFDYVDPLSPQRRRVSVGHALSVTIRPSGKLSRCKRDLQLLGDKGGCHEGDGVSWSGFSGIGRRAAPGTGGWPGAHPGGLLRHLWVRPGGIPDWHVRAGADYRARVCRARRRAWPWRAGLGGGRSRQCERRHPLHGLPHVPARSLYPVRVSDHGGGDDGRRHGRVRSCPGGGGSPPAAGAGRARGRPGRTPLHCPPCRGPFGPAPWGPCSGDGGRPHWAVGLAGSPPGRGTGGLRRGGQPGPGGPGPAVGGAGGAGPRPGEHGRATGPADRR